MSSAVPYAPPPCLRDPLHVPARLLLGPGPSNCPARVLAAGSLPMLGHLHPEFTKIMDDIKAGIQYAFQTKNRVTLAISGTGHAAMEASCCNLVESRDVILSACNGIWGERFADMAARYGADVRTITKEPGEVFSLDEIEKGLASHRPRVVFVTHGESSGGTMQPLDGLGKLCHRYDCLLVVDSVAALGAVPLFMDRWGIDVLYSGAQKVLGCPPGASPISFSQAAWEKVTRRTRPVSSFYFDIVFLANYWGCDDDARRYHHTAPISIMYALREGLAILAEEGLEKSWTRHRTSAERLRQGLRALGLELFVEDRNSLPTITAVRVPTGLNGKRVCERLMARRSIEISGGLGKTAGKIWRIGLMGRNATANNVDLVLTELREAIEWCRQHPQASL